VQVAAIEASITEWGWTTPALVGEDGGLIAGHARVLAARQLGIAEIPVMVAAGSTEAQKRAYVLADNQLAITGSGWDPELLRLELGELKLSGFDLSLTGFARAEGSAGRADRGADGPGRRAGGARASGVADGRSMAAGREGDVPELPQGDAAPGQTHRFIARSQAPMISRG
jgi:ParB-like chromosome segregation protein Spo0J